LSEKRPHWTIPPLTAKLFYGQSFFDLRSRQYILQSFKNALRRNLELKIFIFWKKLF